MFTWLNKQGVRRDKGFEVQQAGRFEIFGATLKSTYRMRRN